MGHCSQSLKLTYSARRRILGEIAIRFSASHIALRDKVRGASPLTLLNGKCVSPLGKALVRSGSRLCYTL